MYINNVLIDTFTYCDISWACAPKCMNLSAGQLALLQETGNLISVRNDNSDANEMWASWSLDVVCAGGGHSYVSSSEIANIQMYYRDVTACPGIELPDDSGGRHWYHRNWITATAGTWVSPVIEDGFKYGKRIYDPSTGTLLPALSYATDSSVGVDCRQLFFRQPFDLPIEPTPVPPSFNITKTASPATAIKGQTNITFTLDVCNYGGGSRGVPLVITDTWVPPGGDTWRFTGFIYGGSNVGWSYTDTLLGSISASSGNGPPTTITFNDGFPNNTCYPLKFTIYSDNPVSQCTTWHNDAVLSMQTSPTKVSTVQLVNFCPSPTVTMTPSPTAGPANFVLSKSASITTGITGNQSINFTVRICNNGDYVPGNQTFTIFDDYSSAQASGGWSYQGPYPPKDPYNYDVGRSTTGEQTTFTFSHGFPGGGYCHDLYFTIQSWSAEPACFTWHNDAFLTYQTSPTVGATVLMRNWLDGSCSTRTVTPTITITNTITRTTTPTITQTPTIPPMDIQLTKTIDRNVVMLGETVTYCLNYRNNGASSASFTIWDTIPANTDFLSCWGTPATCNTVNIGGNNIVYWTISSLASGGSGSVCFNVRASRLPYYPFSEHDIFALYDEYLTFALARGDTAAREGP